MLHTITHVTADVLRELRKEMRIRKTHEVFLLLSLGSQFDHLIKQQLDKLGVFCIVGDPQAITADDVRRINPIGIILSGGPVSVHSDPPKFDTRIFDIGIPVLGICLGFQLWALCVGAQIKPAAKKEFGVHNLKVLLPNSPLFKGIPCANEVPVLESHGDYVCPSRTIQTLGTTRNAPVAAGHHMHLWGVQFHPEVSETIYGAQMFKNFCFGICGAKDVFPAKDVAKAKIRQLRKQLKGKKLLLALSGGSDSSTVAYLLKEAGAGKHFQVRAVYIEGIDRPDDKAHVLKYFSNCKWLQLIVVDATDEFLKALKGIRGMHQKRLAMRKVYKRILQREAKRFGAHAIAQGTLNTDVSESGGGYASRARKAQIKLHHNVGLHFSLPEITPLIDQVKDTGRNIGRSIGVPEALLTRHPFPGPGLVIRIEGSITKRKLLIARELDRILIDELRKAGWYDRVWQAGTFVSHSRTTCTKGDDATSGLVVEYWAFCSLNGFTAQVAELPWELMKSISQRMTNEIHRVGSATYNTTGKPPRTIERG